MINKRHSKKSILLVDDDPSILKMLTMLLETRGYDVHSAQTGKEALEKITAAVDLVILDIVLPDQEGFEVCRKIREEIPTHHIPIIMLSGRLLSEDIVEGLYLGADDYLTKPFDYEELVARMEAVMRRGAMFGQGKAHNSEQAVIAEIKKIIDEERLEAFFQPIFHLKPLKLLGFEALCRPKTESILLNPELLFKAAIQFGYYQDLEILSWKKAIECAAPYIKDTRLFLNCNPYLVEGPRFMAIKAIFQHHNVNVKNIFLEITERSAISDYKVFYEHLKKYRDYGFKFAVDDVGGGFASLEAIVETKPEVVKIDRHIIANLSTDMLKRSIVKFIVSFCQENKIISVAEGIETKEDLQLVMDLGVDAAQGYYLYKPSAHIDLEDIQSVRI